MRAKFVWLVMPVWLIFSFTVTGQFNILNKVKNAANKSINKKVDKTVEGGVDKVLNNQTEKKNTDSSKGSNVNSTTDKIPSLQSYSKFDFIPGEKVIFFDDFTQDAVGDFPALWNTNGSAEIVTTNLFPGRWMKFISRDAVWNDQLLKLPDNYTIEFDIIPIKGTEGGMAGYSFRLLQSVNAKSFDAGAVPGKAGFMFFCEYFGRTGYRTYINGNEGQGLGLSGHNEDKGTYQKENQKYHISIWVQKARVRLYANETKIFDLPKAFPLASVKMDRIRFENGAAMVSNVRIAVGAPDMRNKLLTEGKLISYGIYFDVNKDVVKAESYGTLKEIATILKENPGVRVKIVGHTDSDGADAANLDLSKRRGAAVKSELVNSFGIDASRLESDGLGETKPIAPNDTPANKALNRRVEFIKL